MRRRGIILNRISSSFVEYMLILGIISAVLWGMNIYVKRGVQGKVKDLTDSIIGKQQETDISPTAETTSTTTSVYDSTADTQGFLGGGSRVSSLDKVDYEAESKIVDTDIPDTGGNFVPASSGYSNPGEPIKKTTEGEGTGS
jgi:Flp pilus assembly pilin Flp